MRDIFALSCFTCLMSLSNHKDRNKQATEIVDFFFFFFLFHFLELLVSLPLESSVESSLHFFSKLVRPRKNNSEAVLVLHDVIALGIPM